MALRPDEFPPLCAVAGCAGSNTSPGPASPPEAIPQTRGPSERGATELARIGFGTLSDREMFGGARIGTAGARIVNRLDTENQFIVSNTSGSFAENSRTTLSAPLRSNGSQRRR